MDGNKHSAEYLRTRILHFAGNILFKSDVSFHLCTEHTYLMNQSVFCLFLYKFYIGVKKRGGERRIFVNFIPLLTQF